MNDKQHVLVQQHLTHDAIILNVITLFNIITLTLLCKYQFLTLLISTLMSRQIHYGHKTVTEITINRDHSFPWQIFLNSAGQFARFRGSPQQIFHI